MVVVVVVILLVAASIFFVVVPVGVVVVVVVDDVVCIPLLEMTNTGDVAGDVVCILAGSVQHSSHRYQTLG